MIYNEKNFELDNRTGVNHEGPLANSPLRRLTSSSIIGDRVENASGENLGRINDLMINLKTGKVEYVVLDFNSFLGISGKLFAIPFSEFSPDPSRGIFILNRDREYLQQMPGFDKSHWPDTNNHNYFSEVNSNWEVAYEP